MSEQAYSLHWFRRDLRMQGNPALVSLSKKFSGRVLGVFFFDEKFLARPDFSHNRFGIFLRSIEQLKKQLQSQGGDLLVLNQGPDQGFEFLFDQLKTSKQALPKEVSFCRDYEPFARERDKRIERLLKQKYSIQVSTFRDHLLIEPDELKKDDGDFYKVYTPFSKRWAEKLVTQEIQDRISTAFHIPAPFTLNWEKCLGGQTAKKLDQFGAFFSNNEKYVSVEMPECGEKAAQSKLSLFKKKIHDYKDRRDLIALSPSKTGTSGLSIFYKNGSLSSSQTVSELDLGELAFVMKTGKPPAAGTPEVKKIGDLTFLKELCWREFYYHLLFHCPWVETENFQPSTRSVRWENNEEHFEAWKEGKTGYPIVDASMRALKHTGHMHNRARMIVASFLTKHLLIDWRWGEKYFMQTLLDGDMAPNNGGWQWAASTGCDAQPYFRVFNPTLQSLKFDPEAEFIRDFVPELRNKIVGEEIHEPGAYGYEKPLVEHSVARDRAIARFQSTKGE